MRALAARAGQNDLYQMTLEMTLGNFNVMPAQAGIHDFSSVNCGWIVKSWISGGRRNDGFWWVKAHDDWY